MYNKLVLFYMQEETMPGCTDGVALQNAVRYFRCPPGKAYFCLLSCLVDEDSFILEKMGSPCKVLILE